MDKELVFQGKSVAIDLARVLAFERPASSGVATVLARRPRLNVTLSDGSDVSVEGEDDIDCFMTAVERFLERD